MCRKYVTTKASATHDYSGLEVAGEGQAFGGWAKREDFRTSRYDVARVTSVV